MKDRDEAIAWAKRLMSLPGFFMLDTETTGIDAHALPVSIALVGSRTGTAYVNTLVNPGREIPPDATAIHGITDDHVKDAPAFPEIYPALANFMSGRVTVGYNVSFDRGVLVMAARVAGLPEINREDGLWTCAMLAYAAYREQRGRYGDYKWHKLGDASRHAGLTGFTEHDAVTDARQALALVKWMAEQ